MARSFASILVLLSQFISCKDLEQSVSFEQLIADKLQWPSQRRQLAIKCRDEGANTKCCDDSTDECARCTPACSNGATCAFNSNGCGAANECNYVTAIADNMVLELASDGDLYVNIHEMVTWDTTRVTDVWACMGRDTYESNENRDWSNCCSRFFVSSDHPVYGYETGRFDMDNCPSGRNYIDSDWYYVEFGAKLSRDNTWVSWQISRSEITYVTCPFFQQTISDKVYTSDSGQTQVETILFTAIWIITNCQTTSISTCSIVLSSDSSSVSFLSMTETSTQVQITVDLNTAQANAAYKIRCTDATIGTVESNAFNIRVDQGCYTQALASAPTTSFAYDVLSTGSLSQEIYSAAASWAYIDSACSSMTYTKENVVAGNSADITVQSDGAVYIAIGTAPTTYTFDLRVVADSSNTYTLSSVTVTLSCGTGSNTDITYSGSTSLSRTVGLSSFVLNLQSSDFTAQNSNCGTLSFAISGSTDTNFVANFASQPANFDYTLSSAPSVVAGTYNMVFDASATGGFQKQFTISLALSQPTCTGTLSLPSSETHDLPDVNDPDKTVTITATTSLDNPTDCSVEYYLDPVLTNAVINTATGEVTLTIDNTLVTAQAVTVKQDVKNTATGTVLATNQATYTYSTVCGSESTTLSGSALMVLQQPQEGIQLSATLDQFTSSNPNCQDITYQLDTDTLLRFDLVEVGSELQITLKAQPSITIGTYDYFLTGTEAGGSTFTASNYMEVRAGCLQDQISLKTSSSRSDLTTVDGFPRLVLSLELPVSMASFDISSQFENLFAVNCTLQSFRIANVSRDGTNLTQNEYMGAVSLSFDGKLLISTDLVLENWLVFIEVSNGEKWGGGENYFADVSTVLPSESLAGFQTSVSEVQLDLQSSSQQQVTQISLPNPTEFTSSIQFQGPDFATAILQNGQASLYVNTVYAKVGDYTGQLTLVDRYGMQTEQSIGIKILDTTVVQTVKEVEQTQVVEKSYFSAQIYSISDLGEVIVAFSDSVKDFNYSLLNQTNTNLYVQPSFERAKEESFDPSKLNFTWEPQGFVEKSSNFRFRILITWDNPIQISAGSALDKLVMVFNGSQELLIGQYKESKLNPNSFTLKKAIKKQMEQSEATKNFVSTTESASNFMMIMLICGIVFMIFGAGENRYLVILVRQLQLILNLPLYKVAHPANFLSFVSMAIMIALFDFLEFFLDWDEVTFIQFEDIELSVAEQAENVGYESHDMLKNLNTVALIIMLISTQVFVALVVNCLQRLSGKGKSFYELISKELFFNSLISISLETYLELIVAAYINGGVISWKTNGEIISSCILIVTVLLCFVLLPAATVLTLVDLPRVQSGYYNERMGYMLKPHNLKTKYTASYYGVFQLRRIAFVLTAFLVKGMSGVTMTLQGLYYINLFNCVYLGNAVFWKNKTYWQLELVNELFVAMVCYQIVWFTDFIPEPDSQYQYGWYSIYTTCFFVLVNLCCLLNEFKKTLGLFYRKYSNRLCPSKKEDTQIIQPLEIQVMKGKPLKQGSSKAMQRNMMKKLEDMNIFLSDQRQVKFFSTLVSNSTFLAETARKANLDDALAEVPEADFTEERQHEGTGQRLHEGIEMEELELKKEQQLVRDRNAARMNVALRYFDEDPRAENFLRFYFQHYQDFEQGTYCQIGRSGISVIAETWMPLMKDSEAQLRKKRQQFYTELKHQMNGLGKKQKQIDTVLNKLKYRFSVMERMHYSDD